MPQERGKLANNLFLHHLVALGCGINCSSLLGLIGSHPNPIWVLWINLEAKFYLFIIYFIRNKDILDIDKKYKRRMKGPPHKIQEFVKI